LRLRERPALGPSSLLFCSTTATTDVYTLSLHDALPISLPEAARIGLRCWKQPVLLLLRCCTGARPLLCQSRVTGCDERQKNNEGGETPHGSASAKEGACLSSSALASATSRAGSAPGAKTALPRATNSAPVFATSTTDPVCEPASTMQGMRIISAHQAPSVRLRGCGSGRTS